jgi:hypothetical protein
MMLKDGTVTENQRDQRKLKWQQNNYREAVIYDFTISDLVHDSQAGLQQTDQLVETAWE